MCVFGTSLQRHPYLYESIVVDLKLDDYFDTKPRVIVVASRDQTI